MNVKETTIKIISRHELYSPPQRYRKSSRTVRRRHSGENLRRTTDELCNMLKITPDILELNYGSPHNPYLLVSRAFIDTLKTYGCIQNQEGDYSVERMVLDRLDAFRAHFRTRYNQLLEELQQTNPR